MSTDAVNEIEKVYNDLDSHKQLLNVVDKYVPRGSQEFREALTECMNDEDVPQQRQRSSTIDSTYRKPHLSVHFASNLVTTSSRKNKSGDDLHLHVYPEGILRHSRERSNTYDSTIQRPRKSVGVKSPLCSENKDADDSAVQQLLNKSPDARKIDEHLLDRSLSEKTSTKDPQSTKSSGISPLRRHKSESGAHSKSSSPRSSPNIPRKSRVDSPSDRSRKISAS